MKVVWTSVALREYRAALDTLTEANPQAAERWEADVDRMMEMLENFPKIGHYHRRDIDGEIREVAVGRYRFVYRLPPDIIEIRRVFHVRRDYDPQKIREGFPSGPRAFVLV